MKIASNRKAYYSYSVIESFEAGIKLVGSEVKSIRQGGLTLADSFIFIKDGELFIKNMCVSRYKNSHPMEKIDECRDKKLLLKRSEISKIERMMQGVGVTVIPLEVFVSGNRIKVSIGACKGKKSYDKREDIKKRDIERDSKRELASR